LASPQTSRPSLHSALIEHAVFGLDRWLRQRQGVCEYSENPHCLFRMQPGKAEVEVVLADGTRVAPGATVLNLHLWNEHVPPMSDGGATLNWARALARDVDLSLRELAFHLRWTRNLDDVVALRCDMRLGTAGQSAQLARIAARYGFEPAEIGVQDRRSVQRLAENMFIMLLVLAANPAALRPTILQRNHTLVYLSRLALQRRYAVTDRGHRGAKLC
jgi:hypothetical protein